MLKDLKVAELREVAEAFGVESAGKSKAVLLVDLAEEGVTENDYNKMFNVEVDDDPEIAAEKVSEPLKVKTGRPSETVLVKMNRANPTYQIHGFTFTSTHPYIAMSSEEAQLIFDNDPRGFVIATPRELEEYYS